MLEKTFDPAEIEKRWYAHWEHTGAFRPARPDAEPFTIIIPPPNVTGSLHIGHALDNTLQDVLIRWQRLKGKDARWVVGTDHAGIATQMVVERQLAEKQDKRTNYSREEFVAKVWEWKQESGNQITRQLRRLGASCDWDNEQFTMDPNFSRAVTKVFVDLYNTKLPDGSRLLYRDKRLVNWDPKLKTAISDLEVETREVPGHFWHIRYPLADGVTLADGRDHIVVATTRPETMLADMAVAVHPDDERYMSVIGQHVILPITGRRIRIVADEHADPELGSGAVKITPGHDFNDFEVGRRVGIAPAEMLNMFDAEANVVQIYIGGEPEWGPTKYGDDDSPDTVDEPTPTLNQTIPEEFLGLHRFETRRRVIEMLEAAGLIVQIEAKTIQMPCGDRSGVVVEPWLTDQWYVNAAELAKPAIEAVRSGATQFVPKSWEKTYFNWMENIQPWCVSRQLWWGHRIPVWASTEYRRDGVDLIKSETQHVYVAEDEEDVCEQARKNAGTKTILFFDSFDALLASDHDREGTYALIRDEDVLDTWFSSALWPFATLGWPEETPDLARHYPGDVLVTGFDIIFFWVARMMMQGIHFKGEVPFNTVYCHGLVRDAKGQKMSKSKGNTVDPLVLVDKFGADALRFTLTAMESQGRDIKLDEKRVEGYRNFATKLWNAVRFAQSQGITASASPAPPEAALPVNRWIIAETARMAADAEAALTAYRFDQYADTLYQFVWSRFCDWYLELIKPLMDDEATADETRAVAGWAIDQILVLLHPVMPFITEELWHAQGARTSDLIHARWPELTPASDEAGAEIAWLIDLVSGIRSVRAEYSIPWSDDIVVCVQEAETQAHDWIRANYSSLKHMCNAMFSVDPAPAAGVAVIAQKSGTYVIPLEGLIDIPVERARLIKRAEQAGKEAAALEGRLNSPGFMEKAKPEAVEKAREDFAARSAEAERLRAALAKLG